MHTRAERGIGPTARQVSESLMAHGVLCKETQDTTLRVAPPLVWRSRVWWCRALDLCWHLEWLARRCWAL